MVLLERISQWGELDWAILKYSVITALVIWSFALFLIHVVVTRRLLRKQKDHFDKLARPFLFGDNTNTINRNKFRNSSKEEW